MAKSKQKFEKWYSMLNIMTICDVEIPMHRAPEVLQCEYKKYEYGELMHRSGSEQRFALHISQEFPHERRITMTVWKDWNDILQYIFADLQDIAHTYGDCRIYTYDNLFHDLLMQLPVVKNRIIRYDEGHE